MAKEHRTLKEECIYIERLNENSFLIKKGFVPSMKVEAFAIKCDVCSNLPPETGYTGKSCIEPEVLECPVGYDRCMTIDIKAMFPDIDPFDMKLKNCSISALMCAPDGPANICNRSTINMTSCSMDCCEGDFCNRGESGGSGAEAANLSVWLPGFAAILMALHQKFIS